MEKTSFLYKYLVEIYFKFRFYPPHIRYKIREISKMAEIFSHVERSISYKIRVILKRGKKISHATKYTNQLRYNTLSYYLKLKKKIYNTNKNLDLVSFYYNLSTMDKP